jgi:hypothetical protein
MEPATNSGNGRPTRASRLSVVSLPGGVGSLLVGGDPGYRPIILIVRVRECRWAALSRWEVDLSIVDNWFSDVDRRWRILAGIIDAKNGSVESRLVCT